MFLIWVLCLSNAEAFNQPIGNWNVGKVVSMHAMFDNAYASFNQDINSWDVSNVTDMREMFSSSKTLAFNQPLDKWDLNSVTNMVGMFCHASVFNQDISNWDVSNVTNMDQMFCNASAFNQPIGNWDVSSVTDMCHMFEDANSFNQPIGNWDVSKVTTMEDMFKGAETFNQDIGSWEVKKAEEEEEVSKDKIDENNYGRQAISIQLLDFNENNSSESFINGETRSIKDHETCQKLKFSHEGFLSDQHQKFWGYTNEDISNETEEYQRSAMMIGEFSYWEEICEYLKLSEMVEDEDENILANENLFNEAIASCKVPTNKEMKLMDGLKYAFQDCFILTEKNSQYFYKLLNFFSYALFIDEKFQAEDSESFIELIKKKTKESNPIVINIIAYSTADIT